MPRASIYNMEDGLHQGYRRRYGLIFLFLLMIVLVSVGFFFFQKMQATQSAYQVTRLEGNFPYETAPERGEPVNFLVVGIDYLDEDRISEKQVTSINVFSKQGQEVTAWEVDPKDLSDLSLTWQDQASQALLIQIGQAVKDRLQEPIHYTTLIDFDKFSEYFKDTGGQQFDFDREYHLPQFTIPQGNKVTLSPPQLNHSMFPVSGEAYSDYNQRQANLVWQTYQGVLADFYSVFFQQQIQQFFALIKTNVPDSYIIEDGFNYIIHRSYQFRWQDKEKV